MLELPWQTLSSRPLGRILVEDMEGLLVCACQEDELAEHIVAVHNQSLLAVKPVRRGISCLIRDHNDGRAILQVRLEPMCVDTMVELSCERIVRGSVRLTDDAELKRLQLGGGG